VSERERVPGLGPVYSISSLINRCAERIRYFVQFCVCTLHALSLYTLVYITAWWKSTSFLSSYAFIFHILNLNQRQVGWGFTLCIWQKWLKWKERTAHFFCSFLISEW